MEPNKEFDKIYKNNDVVSLILKERILDEKTCAQPLAEQESTGKALLDVLRQGNSIDKQQYGKILAAMNRMEFVNLAPEMVDPMAACMVGQYPVNQKTDQKQFMHYFGGVFFLGLVSICLF